MRLPKLTYKKHYAHLISRDDDGIWRCAHPLCQAKFAAAPLPILKEFLDALGNTTIIISSSETLGVIINEKQTGS